jgi:cupin fold WbuC family metalloprotein
MKYTTVNEEVLVSLDPVTRVDHRDIAWLKARAAKNQRKTVRLCAHRSVDDPVHEMLIVHSKGARVRPHKHPNKSESFHIIEGKLDIVVFDDSGGVVDVINMGDYPSGERFFWRLSESYYHTVIPRSDVVVFHETTNGPFERSTSNVGAPWSPEETDLAGLERYLAELDVLLDSRKEAQ